MLGKPIGIMAATWLTARFTRADLDEDLAWVDMLGLSVLAGIGFTVSLLIGELAFGAGRDGQVKVAVLAGSVRGAARGGDPAPAQPHVPAHPPVRVFEVVVGFRHGAVPAGGGFRSGSAATGRASPAPR